MYYIGVDLGGTNIAAGIVNDEGKIIARIDEPTGVMPPAKDLCIKMGEMAKRLIEENGMQVSDIECIGFGVPGITFPDTGNIVYCTNLGWRDVPLREYVQSVIDLPVYIGNDATVAGYAEFAAGAAKDAKNAVFLTLGTGLGGGIVIDGKVYSGSHNVGSELGHMIVEVGGELCNCGNRGCWERYASATGMVILGKKALEANPDSCLMEETGGDMEKLTAKMIVDASKAGDAVAVEIFDEYAKYLSAGIGSIINILDPDVISLGGGVSKAGQYLIDAINIKSRELALYQDIKSARIVIAQLGSDAGIIGAALQCRGM